MRFRASAAAVCCAALLSVAPGVPLSAEERSNACTSGPITTGAGVNLMQWCVSAHGNLTKFESGSGQDHIAAGSVIRDGYAVCSADAGGFNVDRAYDVGGLEGGWNFGLDSFLQPNGPGKLPITVTRTTLDGRLQIVQKFTQDANEKDITITVTVKNVSATPQENVRVSRTFEGDIANNSVSSRFSRTGISVFNYLEGSGGTALNLVAGTLSPATPIALTQVEWLQHFYPAALPAGQNAENFQTGRRCIGASAATPVFDNTGTVPAGAFWSRGANNHVGRVVYNLGNLNAGKTSKPVKFVYRRQ